MTLSFQGFSCFHSLPSHSGAEIPKLPFTAALGTQAQSPMLHKHLTAPPCSFIHSGHYPRPPVPLSPDLGSWRKTSSKQVTNSIKNSFGRGGQAHAHTHTKPATPSQANHWGIWYHYVRTWFVMIARCCSTDRVRTLL